MYFILLASRVTNQGIFLTMLNAMYDITPIRQQIRFIKKI